MRWNYHSCFRNSFETMYLPGNLTTDWILIECCFVYSHWRHLFGFCPVWIHIMLSMWWFFIWYVSWQYYQTTESSWDSPRTCILYNSYLMLISMVVVFHSMSHLKISIKKSTDSENDFYISHICLLYVLLHLSRLIAKVSIEA